MIEIKQISKLDINKVVSTHNDAFKDFFLTSLGDNFLKLYYNSVRKNEKGLLLGLYEDDELCGFCAAATQSKGFNSNLVKSNIYSFGLMGLQLIVTRMPALLRLIKNFSKENPDFDDNGNYAELLSIGVSTGNQGKGIGKKLLLQLEESLKNKGIEKLSLTTDYYNNEKTIQFYKGLGYTIYYDFITHPNRRMYRMIKIIK